ncbi:MAG: hypothetical protein GY779_09500 [Gammaproteobacteria bacterium]|nr:hypothetical protein [Gammaproteobacteria bacterium]
MAENSAFSGTTPTLSGDTPIGNITYSLSGSDAGDFSVAPGTGLVNMAAQNYESPADADSNNVYNLTLTATDEDNNSASQAFSVTVTDVSEGGGGVVDTSYILNYEATSETIPSDGTWNYATGQSGFDFTLTGATLTNTGYAGITQAYQFDGSGGGTMESLQDISGNPTDADTSFELWFRPNSLSGGQILFETGGRVDGTALYLSGNNLIFATRDNRASPDQISVDLTGIQADPTAEFIQAVAVINRSAAQIELFVNGVSQGTAGLTGVDWAGGDNTGLGRGNGGVAAGSGQFNGDIAIVRFYEKALTESEIQGNFSAISGGAE